MLAAMNRRLAVVAFSFAAACSKAEPKPAPPFPPVGPVNPPKSAAPAAAPKAGPTRSETPKVEPPRPADPSLDQKTVKSPTGISFDVPAGWRRFAPGSSMRVAELGPPRAEGDTTDSTLVVTYFRGGAGTLESNIDRWLGQMLDASGAPTPRERARIEELTISGHKATVVDVESGTYKDTGPMAATTPTVEHARLLAAQLEGPEGAYFFKLTGPAKTVGAARDAYLAMLKSAKL